MASTGKGALLTDQHRRRQVSLAITADSQARRAWDATLDLNDLTGTQPIWKRTMLNLIQTWWRISEQAALAYLPQYREAETGEGRASRSACSSSTAGVPAKNSTGSDPRT